MAARSEDRSGSPACPSSGAPSSNPGLGAGLPRSVLAGFGSPGFIALTALAVLGFLWLGRGLPRVPWVASDTQSYVSFSPVRPHGYSLFLAAYRLLFSDLAYLPSLQFGLYVGAVFLLALAVGRRTCNFAAAAATLLITFAAADMTDFPYILSDGIYAAALTAGMACLILYAETLRPTLLVLAATGFGIALTCRAIGVALLPGFFLAVMASRIGRRGGLARVILLSLLPITVLYCGAASSQLVHNGRFTLGNWGGMDLLGKLPLLSRPVSGSAGRLNEVVEAMEPARLKLARLNPLLAALAARQYYEYLRWYVIVPDLERTWAAWRDADDYGRGKLAAELAKAYLAEDTLGFLQRTKVDLVGLWAMPRWLTVEERAAALAELEGVGELPFLTAFSHTSEGQLEYYKVVPDPTDPTKVVMFRTVVVAFWILSLGFIVLVAWHRAGAVRVAPDLLSIVLAVHAVYIGTALMEGGHERYIMPTWPVLVAGPILALGLLRRVRRQPRWFQNS